MKTQFQKAMSLGWNITCISEGIHDFVFDQGMLIPVPLHILGRTHHGFQHGFPSQCLWPTTRMLIE